MRFVPAEGPAINFVGIYTQANVSNAAALQSRESSVECFDGRGENEAVQTKYVSCCFLVKLAATGGQSPKPIGIYDETFAANSEWFFDAQSIFVDMVPDLSGQAQQRRVLLISGGADVTTTCERECTNGLRYSGSHYDCIVQINALRRRFC